MSEKIVVTSIGIISALGQGKNAHVSAFRAQQSGLRNPKHLKSKYADEFVLGEVRLSNDELSELVGLPTGDNGYTRTTLLALAAVLDIVNDAGLALLQSEPTAFINANTVGGMCTVENMYMEFIAPTAPEEYLKYIDTLDCAESTQRITEHFGLNAFSATVSTACSSSANAFILGARLIKHGIVKRAICGGCDSLSRFTLNGFHSLKNVDKNPSKPFDQNRLGLNLGEGAGYVLLETESSAKERGAHIIAELSGYYNSNDAYHPTAPSPDGSGAYRTMQKAMEMAGIQPEDIGYINAHGTATQSNDSAEGKAIENLFGSNAPYFSSTKPFVGHTLAAAGSLEAIFSMYAMEEQMIIPNLNFETRMEELNISPVASLIENVALKHVLSNSFGFGGNNVSLVFSKP